MDWILLGWNRISFLKVLKQPVRNIEKIWKYALKWTRYLISMLIVSFDRYEHVLAISLEKRKTNFLRLYFWSSLCCHYGISNIFLHCQNLFLLKSVLKKTWAEGWQGKRKQMETILLRYQPSVTCNPRIALKSTFDFNEIVNEWKWKRGRLTRYVRFISQLS